MQFEARFPSVEARRACVLSADNKPEGDPFYLLESAGGTVAVVDTATFDALYSPAAPKPVQERNRVAQPPKPKADLTPARTERPSVPQLVLDLIKAGPARTSGQLFDVLQKKYPDITSGAVYQATKFHKDKGIVIPLVDDSIEGGGVVKWYAAPENRLGVGA